MNCPTDGKTCKKCDQDAYVEVTRGKIIYYLCQEHFQEHKHNMTEKRRVPICMLNECEDCGQIEVEQVGEEYAD